MHDHSTIPNHNECDPHIQREEPSVASKLRNRSDAPKRNIEKGFLPQREMITDFPEQQRLKNYVFTDPVAFRYLEEDPSAIVVDRNKVIEGYKLYFVEQWACSRTHPTFVITTYTGDPDHKGFVSVLGLPSDEDSWSPRLQSYFKATSQFYARLQETPLGMLMVTNLNSLPSTLTIIPVPDGDLKRYKYSFIVNENLKRLGCSGRSGISLTAPAGATQAKFLQLFKISQRISLSDAVIELVKLCQIALVVFGKLEQEYIDGCLCDMTEKAITEWWTEIGSEHYNTEPSDGILGPTTVAGLLGLLIGARNRLSSCGAPVGKDSFDLYNMKRGIEQFQKSNKLKRTRRLDRHTLDRLHKATAKITTGEGWAVPKAVKSTVAELSGKGSEMVLGIVGRDKAGIGDIETLDIDHFISLAHGERTKWLWHGKPRRGGPTDSQSIPSIRDDQTAIMWPHNKLDIGPTEDESEKVGFYEKPPHSTVYFRHPPGSALSIPDSPIDRDQFHKAVFKSVSGKMTDAKNGLGRLKDAVGFRGHGSKHSKDEGINTGLPDISSGISSSTGWTPSAPLSSQLGNKTFTWKDTPTKYLNGAPKSKDFSLKTIVWQVKGGPNSHSSYCEYPINTPIDLPQTSHPHEKGTSWTTASNKNCREISVNDTSFAGSCDEIELEGVVLQNDQYCESSKFFIERRSSIPGGVETLQKSRNENWWPRHMSFSGAEDALFCWEPTIKSGGEEWNNNNVSSDSNYISQSLSRLSKMLEELQDDIKPWVEAKLHGVSKIDEQLSQDQASFQIILAQLTEQYQHIKLRSQEALDLERTHVIEAMKEIETLGAKLDYEINTLDSKVHDVEDGVVQLERQVNDLESRADNLEMRLKTESWTYWIIRSITGIGTGSDPILPVET